MLESRRLRGTIYSTRGVWLLLAQGALLYVKDASGVKMGLPLYLAALAVAVAAQAYRTWAAGFVGTTARGQAVQAGALLTAGPYARVRNPMYLGNLFIVVALGLMSGLWYSPLVTLGSWTFVYSSVIPYEEDYLARRFGEEYQSYRRQVPRLWPTLRPYPSRQGRFDLKQGLVNEVFAIPGLLVVAALFYLL